MLEIGPPPFPMKTDVLLRHANGYRILEMFEDAELELAKIAAEEQMDDAPLTLKIALFQDSGKWQDMLEVATVLRDRYPEEADWWIAVAYATRRCLSIEQAREVLLSGIDHHPKEPCIQYNLGCYACVMGERDEALARVRSAIELDSNYSKMAIEDEDLEAIRDELR